MVLGYELLPACFVDAPNMCESSSCVNGSGFVTGDVAQVPMTHPLDFDDRCQWCSMCDVCCAFTPVCQH